MSYSRLSCAKCAVALESGDQFCAACGAPAPAAAPARAPTCSNCGFAPSPSDRFCLQCGASLAGGPVRLSAAATSARAGSPTAPLPAPATFGCRHCGATLIPGDEFCFTCGQRVRSASESAGLPTLASAASLLLPGDASRFSCDELLAVRRPFCRACGTDHDHSDRVCPACGTSVASLPERLAGTLGEVYVFRRGLRKRSAVRLADDGETAKLMFESGEITTIDLAEMPDPAESPVPDAALAAVRTPNGSMLRLAEACAQRVIKNKWDPNTLIAAALDEVDDVTTARLVALDLTALGRNDLIAQLPLTESEQQWLAAVRAPSEQDASAILTAVSSLPVGGYRPKLGLLALMPGQAATAGLDLRAIGPHVAAFLDQEPVAALLHRALGFAAATPTSEPAQLEVAVATNTQLLDYDLLPDQVAREIAAGLAVLGGNAPSVPEDLRFAPSSVRVLLARQEPRPGIVRAEDVDAMPHALIDDLVDSGALEPAIAVAGSTDPARSLYTRARFAPARLTDQEVRRLDHADERIRRAFRYGELAAVDDLAGTPTLRHYRALEAVRRRRSADVLLDDVHADARPAVEDLLRLIAAKADGVAPSERLTERMLADPTVWPVLVEIAGPTALQPTEQLLSRFPQFTEWLALHQAREHLFVGEWQAAVTASDRCLALAHAEPVRDEALNLKACGLHYLGRDDQAITALEEAIEGAYSESLLANVGVVAAGLRPEVAARHLGVLIAEAPTTPMRVAAARRAVSIWRTSDTASWRNSDESPLPDAFQEALRELVIADLELDDFREFASLLAVNDSDWFQDETHVASSPHSATLEARFYVARAGNLIRMVEEMGRSIAFGAPPAWVLFERDSLRSAALDILFENLDEPDSTFGTVALAMADNGVLDLPGDNVLFSALGVAGLAYHLSERKTEVADHIAARVHLIRKEWQGLESEHKSRTEPAVELATRRVAINRMNARDNEMSEAIDLFNGAVNMGQYAEYGSPAYREAMRRIGVALEVARSARRDLLPWPPIIEHEGVLEGLNQSLEQTREIERRCLEIMN